MDRCTASVYRERLVRIATGYMAGALGLSPEFIDTAAASASGKPWIEFAHTPQFPHMGIVRMYLVAQREALRRKGLVVYCVNDHLAPRYLAESRYLPIHNRDKVVAAPPALALAKTNAKRAMHKLPAPGPETLAAFVYRLQQLLPQCRPAIDQVTECLGDAAAVTSDLAAWFTRIWVAAIGDPVLVFPTSRFADVFTHYAEFDALAKLHGYCWQECAQCGYRAGKAMPEGAVCASCGSGEMEYRPDVVGRQVISNQLEYSARVCGGAKDYQGRADAISVQLGIPCPPRIAVTGRTVIRQDDIESGRRNLFEPAVFAAYRSAGWRQTLPDGNAEPWLLSV